MCQCNPPIPSFSPEHFAVARGADPSKHKQFRRRIEQLEQEGVVQVLRSDRRGEQAPISLESLPYQVARVVDPADAEFMSRQVSSEVMTRSDGVMLVLLSTPWRQTGSRWATDGFPATYALRSVIPRSCGVNK